MSVTGISLTVAFLCAIALVVGDRFKALGSEIPAVKSPIRRIGLVILGAFALCVAFLSSSMGSKIIAHYNSQPTTKAGVVKPETESPAPNMPPQSPSPSSATKPAHPKSGSAHPASASATATQPPAPATAAQPAAPDPPLCVTGHMVKDWTVDYDFQGSTSDTTGPAYPTSIYVSEDLNTNFRSDIRSTTAFKKEVDKLREQTYLKEDEQKRLYDILKEIKKLKDLTPKPTQGSYGPYAYRNTKESITYSHSDAEVYWRYSLQGNNNQEAGLDVKGPYSVKDLSGDSRAVLRNLDIKIGSSVDNACNDGEAELSTSH
jgi:hypothetical protein